MEQSNVVKGGFTTYGFDIGIIMLDSAFPRIVGDVGNAKTWNYPVLYKEVENYTPNKVVLDLEMSDIEPFVEAAIWLQNKGVKAITTSCGFLALFQNELRKRINVPVFTSTLVMLPFLCRTVGKMLVLSANSDTLTSRHLQSACGNLAECDYKIVGTQSRNNFTNFTVQNWNSVDTEKCKEEIISVLRDALDSDDSFSGILLECTNLPPYSDYIRNEFGLPVFDFVNMIDFVHSSYVDNQFSTIMKC